MLFEEAKTFKEILKEIKDCRILNIGSMSTPLNYRYHPWVINEVIAPLISRKNKIVNLDMTAGKGVDIVCDCQDMNSKVKDVDFDMVLFTNTIEHLFSPHKAISEIYRVLKPGGKCYASCPSEGYPYHEDPIDTMLRISTLEEWVKYFGTEHWQIDLFKVVKSYRPNFFRVDGVTIIRAVKI